MPVILRTSNIIIDYGASNFTMETVKTSPFIQKNTVGSTSNLLAEPFVDTVSRMYPPERIINANSFSLSNGGHIVSIFAGQNHTMLITNEGKVYAYGNNSKGQLGLGDTTSRTTPTLINTTTNENVPIAFNNLIISSIACGSQYTVFVTNQGKVYTCGINTAGQLGFQTNVATQNANSTPTLISISDFISSASCGLQHTLFLSTQGKVYGCGRNKNYELGVYRYVDITPDPNIGWATVVPIDSTTSETTPKAFDSLTIIKVAAGANHSLFLTNNGRVYSCGNNSSGQIGRGDVTFGSIQGFPRLIILLDNIYIHDITAGFNHSLFRSGTSVYACGSNWVGELGIGDNGRLSIGTPQQASVNSTIDFNSHSSCQHTLFLNNNYKVYSCGMNYSGQLGRASKINTFGDNPIPELILETTVESSPKNFNNINIHKIAAGGSHSVFLTNNGDVYSCGLNDNGQLGVDTGGISKYQPHLTNLSSLSSINFGLGTYTVSYSSFTASSEPFRCFNNTSSVNNAATWAANNYTSGTGIYNKTLNLVSGYNGDWVRIQLPVSIKLRSFAIKQISTALNRAPNNFRFYGSTNGTSWNLLVDKTNTVYTNLFYTHTDMSEYASNTNQFYNHFGIVVNSLLGTSETTLSFDELYIYGSEQVTFTRSVVDSTNKLLSFTLLYGLSNYPNSDLGYNITFPTPTFVNSISTSTNLILRGEYRLNILNSSSSQLIPNGGQTNIVNIGTLNLPTTNVQVNYHLLNPLRNDSESAQWTYSPIDTSVYHLGNVGIMTKTSSYQLEVNNNIYVSGTAFTGSSQTNWVILSDKRIKENIVKASYETCFENVKNIELYRFNFKANTVNSNDYNQLGFIAQEVRNFFPKAVEVNMIQDNNGIIPDLLTLNITQIKYTLYGAVKYLLEKIEKLERKLELKNRAYTGILDGTLYFQGNNIGTLDFQGSNIKILDNQGSNIGTLDFQ